MARPETKESILEFLEHDEKWMASDVYHFKPYQDELNLPAKEIGSWFVFFMVRYFEA
jgi:hypothetical protein